MKAVDLDHVAIATDDIGLALASLVGELGGTLFHGGDGYGFRWLQTRLGDATAGMTIESLVAWQPDVDDFLARFLERHGPSAHHITFKVPDIEVMIERCRARGLEPVGVRIDDRQWREAFLQPREAHGTVVQLAQTDEPFDLAVVLPAVAHDGPLGTPRWWPDPPEAADAPATLRRVVLGSPDRAATTTFFTEVLDGVVEATDHDTDNRAGATDLVWPGGGRIRLEDADRTGVLRLEATGPTPRTVMVGRVPFVVT